MSNDLNNFGYSLIEVLITLTIISLVLSFAIPGYQHYLVATNRKQAIYHLLHLANALEKYSISHQTFENATLTNLNIPAQIINKQYVLSIETTTTQYWRISATPLKQQAKRDTGCGILIYSSDGMKRVGGHNTWQACWY